MGNGLLLLALEAPEGIDYLVLALGYDARCGRPVWGCWRYWASNRKRPIRRSCHRWRRS